MFVPDYNLLKKYADILVKFALRSGEWAKPWDVIFVQLPECAKPFYLPLQKAILEVWAHPIFEYSPDWVGKHFYENSNNDQITFYPSHLFEGKIKQMTHVIWIIAEADKNELKWVDTKKITNRIQSRKQYRDMRTQKEAEWKLTWVLGLYGTQAMADEANMSLEEYRDQIIKACYLDQENPIQKRKDTFSEINQIMQKLNNLNIQKVHVKSEEIDLEVKIWSDRQWLWWSGRNIPSFEIFTSPDRRWINWTFKSNQSFYRYGRIIKWAYFKIENGTIIEFDAEEWKDLLADILDIPWTNHIWEFSLTDGRHSHITKFMAETLYDENAGGKFWNTHIAIWLSFEETYRWDERLTDELKEKFWFNQSAEHLDFVSTSDRTVTATLPDWSEKIIYQNWEFTI